MFGTNFGHTLERTQSLKDKFGDDFVSVEHLFLALFDDPRVGHTVLREAGLDKAKAEEAVKVWPLSAPVRGWIITLKRHALY